MTPQLDGNGLIRVAVFCGGATQTALWADGIQQQFVQRWLLQQTSNSGDGRDFSFLSSRLDLASLKSSRKPPVRSDRPTQNHQRDSNAPKKLSEDKETRRALDSERTRQMNGANKRRYERWDVVVSVIAPTFTFQTLSFNRVWLTIERLNIWTFRPLGRRSFPTTGYPSIFTAV